jgi:hypothetical protein
MLSDWLGRVILRDLESLVGQLNGYGDEKDIWRQVPGIANTTGTLALHLAGNLEHYIGAELGQSGSMSRSRRSILWKKAEAGSRRACSCCIWLLISRTILARSTITAVSLPAARV